MIKTPYQDAGSNEVGESIMEHRPSGPKAARKKTRMSPAAEPAPSSPNKEEVLDWDYALETVPARPRIPVKATVTIIPPRPPLAD